jgi:hypothetical protein
MKAKQSDPIKRDGEQLSLLQIDLVTDPSFIDWSVK